MCDFSLDIVKGRHFRSNFTDCEKSRRVFQNFILKTACMGLLNQWWYMMKTTNLLYRRFLGSSSNLSPCRLRDEPKEARKSLVRWYVRDFCLMKVALLQELNKAATSHGSLPLHIFPVYAIDWDFGWRQTSAYWHVFHAVCHLLESLYTNSLVKQGGLHKLSFFIQKEKETVSLQLQRHLRLCTFQDDR